MNVETVARLPTVAVLGADGFADSKDPNTTLSLDETTQSILTGNFDEV